MHGEDFHVPGGRAAQGAAVTNGQELTQTTAGAAEDAFFVAGFLTGLLLLHIFWVWFGFFPAEFY